MRPEEPQGPDVKFDSPVKCWGFRGQQGSNDGFPARSVTVRSNPDCAPCYLCGLR